MGDSSPECCLELLPSPRLDRLWTRIEESVSDQRIHPSNPSHGSRVRSVGTGRVFDTAATNAALRQYFRCPLRQRHRGHSGKGHTLAEERSERLGLTCTRAILANGYVENLNGKLRDELLDEEWFHSRAEARLLIERRRKLYIDWQPRSANSCKSWSTVRRRRLKLNMTNKGLLVWLATSSRSKPRELPVLPKRGVRKSSRSILTHQNAVHRPRPVQFRAHGNHGRHRFGQWVDLAVRQLPVRR